MKTNWASGFNLAVVAILSIHGAMAQSPPSPERSAPIPMDQLGALAGKPYGGDGLSVVATPDGARLRCSFQQLEGEVTTDGLWLRSTVAGSSGDHFRVKAVKVARATPNSPADVWPVTDPFIRAQPAFASAGTVRTVGHVARFVRDGLTEEYSVSVDGVRQDFIIEQRPDGEGELRVDLDVTGAKAEPLVQGVRLILASSGRKLNYHRLHVTDANGRELSARLEVSERNHLAVVVDEANAVYPVRIDPTFSDDDWISMGGLNGASSPVHALAVDDWGNLYVGGQFELIGDVRANRIAKWDGNGWSALGSGIGGGPPTQFSFFYPRVRQLVSIGTNLYVAGEFSVAGTVYATNIARWDGTTWSALGSGLSFSVDSSFGIRAMACDQSNLYVGGSFTTNNGNVANFLVKWNGTVWSGLGSGVDGEVNSLAIKGGNLYVGGKFNNAGGVPVNCLAQWNGVNWADVGGGVTGNSPRVYALAATDGELYVGGEFSMAGTVAANCIAKWNGNAWSALGSGMNSGVLRLVATGTNLYACGSFTVAGSVPANRIAKWNGSTWSALGTGFGAGSENQVDSIVILGDQLYAGGWFYWVGGVPVRYLAKWNGNNWLATSPGTDSGPFAMTVLNNELYAGGQFTVVGGVPANHIAKWNGSDWFPLGTGVNGSVYSLAGEGQNLYVGGAFTEAGGVVVNHIAKWDGREWAALGPGFNGSVSALAVIGTNLYAGGSFSSLMGPTMKGIAKWDGNAWTSLGSGIDDGTVSALTVLNGELYAAGGFTSAGGVAAKNIAKWNGNNWAALGSGMNYHVFTLASINSEIYAGGYFTLAGGVAANRIARWNGSQWFALGSGLEGDSIQNIERVLCIAKVGKDLLAGGYFERAGGVPANGIARWDGTNWSALGSGTGGASALAVLGNNLIVGGGGTAGNKVSVFFARTIIGDPPFPGRFIRAGNVGGGFSCTFLDGSIGQPYRIQRSPSLSPATWTDLTIFIYTGPIVIADVPVGSVTNGFFRAVTP